MITPSVAVCPYMEVANEVFKINSSYAEVEGTLSNTNNIFLM